MARLNFFLSFAVAKNHESLARGWKRQEPRRSLGEGGLSFGVISRVTPAFKPVVASFLFIFYAHTVHASHNWRSLEPAAHQALLAFNTPDGFGKTHFIVGMPAAQQAAKLADKACATDECSAAAASDSGSVFFGPDDNLRHKLLDFIAHEKKSLKIAVYMFTDKKIAQALIDAQRKGVQIEVLTDPTCIKDKYNKINMLVEHDIPVYVYEVAPNAGHTIMHHKFVVFGENKNAQPLVWCGSFNFTKSAHERNKETVVMLYDPSAIQKFSTQFELLKTQCVCCKNKLQLAKTMMK